MALVPPSTPPNTSDAVAQPHSTPITPSLAGGGVAAGGIPKPKRTPKAREEEQGALRKRLDDNMSWNEICGSRFMDICGGEKPPTGLTFSGAFDSVERTSEQAMYPGLTNGINDLFAALKINDFVAVHTGSRPDTSIKRSAEDTDLNLLRPDISINWTGSAAYHKDVESLGEDQTGSMPSTTGQPLADTARPGPSQESRPTAQDAQPKKKGKKGRAGPEQELSLEDQEKQAKKTSLAQVSARMSWAWAEVVIEVKHFKNKALPFASGPDGFLPSDPSGESARSRGQILEYACEVFRRQHRLFVFAISIYGDNARLLRLDRAGAIVSQAFDYRQNPDILAEFLHRVFRPKARAARGHDPTVKLATPAQVVSFRSLHKRADFTQLERDALARAATAGWEICRIRIYSPWAPLESIDGSAPVFTRAVRPSDQMAIHTCLVGRPVFSSPSMVSRGTKVCVGYDVDADVPVVIKEAWRHDRKGTERTELRTYHKLWEDHPRRDEYSQYLLTPLGGGDVIDAKDVRETDPIPEPHRTLVLPASEAKSERIPRVQVRLVLKEVCAPITAFKHAYYLVRSIYHALLAHEFAWTAHGLLHQDLSAGNILIYTNKDGDYIGKLADWDIAKSRDELQSGQTLPWRSGTWHFISAILTHAPGKLHAPSDDLESSMHVLSWVVINCLQNRYSHNDQSLSDHLQSRFEGYFTNVDDEGKTHYLCKQDKFDDVKRGTPLVELSAGFEDHPLNTLLRTLAALCKKHYTTVEALVPRKVTTNSRPGPKITPHAFTPRRQRVKNPLPLVPLQQEPDVKPENSPLEDHEQFLDAFEDALATESWSDLEDVPRITASETPTVSTTRSVPPGSFHVGQKRSAPSTASKAQPTKRGRPGSSVASSSRMASSSTAANDVTYPISSLPSFS